MFGLVDRIFFGVKLKEVDGFIEKEVYIWLVVNEKMEIVFQKFQGGIELLKSIVLSFDDDNKQLIVKVKVMILERGDELEVKQNVDSFIVVSGDDKQKIDDNFKWEFYIKKIEDIFNLIENIGINIYDNKMEFKFIFLIVVRFLVEKFINKKNVFVI